MRPPAANRADQEARFAAFTRDYNEERPHEALEDLPPARLYKPSPREMPERLPEPDYPAEAALRKVRSNGEIKWGGRLVPISCALVGEAVAIEETEKRRLAGPLLRSPDRHASTETPSDRAGPTSRQRTDDRARPTTLKAVNHASGPNCQPSIRWTLGEGSFSRVCDAEAHQMSAAA